jgi:hypothetical protein
MRTRRVSLRVSTTSKLLMFSSFLFRPIMFFLVPGLILGLIAIWTLGGVLLMVIEQFPATTGSLDGRVTDAFARAYELRPHSFIVGGIAFVIAVQLISLGVLAHQSKRYFEELYHLGIGLNRRIGALEGRDPFTAEESPAPDAAEVAPPLAAVPDAPAPDRAAATELATEASADADVRPPAAGSMGAVRTAD